MTVAVPCSGQSEEPHGVGVRVCLPTRTKLCVGRVRGIDYEQTIDIHVISGLTLLLTRV